MCVVRISGNDFDVEAALSVLTLVPDRIFRKGELMYKSKPKGPIREWSGFCFQVSEAKWSDLPAQVEDASKFIRQNRSELIKLKALPNVGNFVLDFPNETRLIGDIVVQSDEFSAELVELAGSVGLGLVLSNYGV